MGKKTKWNERVRQWRRTLQSQQSQSDKIKMKEELGPQRQAKEQNSRRRSVVAETARAFKILISTHFSERI